MGWIHYFDLMNTNFGILITPLREATEVALKFLFPIKVSLVQHLQNMKTFLKPHSCKRESLQSKNTSNSESFRKMVEELRRS
jgi:hypothetical protein